MMPAIVTKVSLVSLVVLVGLVACQNKQSSGPELKRADETTTERYAGPTTEQSSGLDNQENFSDNLDSDLSIYNDFGKGPNRGFRGFNDGRRAQQNLANPMGGLFGNSFDDFPFGPRHRHPEGGMMPPPPPPPSPSNFLSSLLGVDVFEPLRRSRDMFERRFQDLSIAPGYSVEKFYRNGVAYERTCTTKRLSQDNQQDEQRQEEQGQQEQKQQPDQQLNQQQDEQLNQQQDRQRLQESEQQQQQQQQPQSELKNQQQQQQNQPQV